MEYVFKIDGGRFLEVHGDIISMRIEMNVRQVATLEMTMDCYFTRVRQDVLPTKILTDLPCFWDTPSAIAISGLNSCTIQRELPNGKISSIGMGQEGSSVLSPGHLDMINKGVSTVTISTYVTGFYTSYEDACAAEMTKVLTKGKEKSK